MTSSTEALSAGSVHECEDSQNLKCTPPRRVKRSPPTTPENQPSDEVKHEIDEFLCDVPQVEKDFTITDKIGSGTFSSVYVGRVKKFPHYKEQFALKHIIPTSCPSRIENELKCLQEIGGKDNVIGVKACLRHKDHVVFVMPYFQHERFQDYVLDMSLGEVQIYMKNLLLSLARVHHVDIIHRDVKPSNFLYNRKSKQFALVDFGLAQKAPVPLKDQKNTLDLKDEKRASVPPNKTRSNSVDSYHVEQSRKRKLAYDEPENQNVSPNKKRILSDGKSVKVPADSNLKNVRVSIMDINKAPAHQRSFSDGGKKPLLRQIDTNTLGAPNNAFYSKTKSPRRELLTKRTLACQGQTKDTKFLPGKAAVTKRATPVIVEKDGKQMYQSVAPTSCKCYARPFHCQICDNRRSQHAPRAGTPGFRAPEVLMKYPDQTTAVDMWAAGVILLSMLSGRYPFFKANDDVTALVQIMVVFGSEKVKQAAKSYGKNLLCSPTLPGHDLPELCKKLRGISDVTVVKSSRGRQVLEDDVNPPSWDDVPRDAFDLLLGLMDLDPTKRLTAEQALKHDFFRLSLQE